MTAETVTTIFQIEADQKSVQEVLKSIMEVDSRTSALGKTADDMAKSSTNSGNRFLQTLQRTVGVLNQVKSTGGLGGLIKTADIIKAEAEVKRLGGEFEELANFIGLAERGMEGLSGEELEKATAETNKLYQQMVLITEELDGVTAKWDKVIAKEEEAQKALPDVKADAGPTYSEKRKGLRESGGEVAADLASSASGLKGVAMVAGNKQLADTFEVVDAIGNIAELVPKLGLTLSSLGEAAGKVEGPLGKLASAALGLAPAVGGSAASLLAFGAVAAPFAGIIAAGAFAITKINEQYKNHYAIMNQVLARTNEYYKLLATGNANEVEDAIATAQETYDIAKAKSDETTALVEGTYKDASQGFGVFTDTILEGMGVLQAQGYVQLRDLRYQNDENKKATEKAKTELDSLGSLRDRERVAIRSTADAIGRASSLYSDAITSLRSGDAETVLKNLTDAETKRITAATRLQYLEDQRAKATGVLAEELDKQIATLKRGDVGTTTEQVKVLTDTLKNFGVPMDDINGALEAATHKTAEMTEAEKKLLDARTHATDSLNQLAEDYGKQEQDYSDAVGKTSEDRRIRDTRDQQDFDLAREEKKKSHEDKLVEIEEGAREKIKNIRSDLGAIPAKRQADMLAAQAKFETSRSKLETEYMRSSTEAYNSFYEKQKQSAEADALQRLRKIEDTGKALRKAEFENNVVAYLDAQDQSQTDLERMQEDATIKQQQETDSYLSEQEKRKEQFDERQADLTTQLATERQKIADSYAEQQTMLNAKIDAEVVAARERLKQEDIEYQAQLKDEDAKRALKLQRQAEDDALSDKREKEALDKQLAAIDKKAQEELKALQDVDKSAQGLSVSANAAATGITQLAYAISRLPAAGSTSGRSGSSGSGGGSAGRVTNRGGGGGLSPTMFANEGVVDRPTLAVLGDKLNPGEGEAAVRFKMSDGIPSRFTKDNSGNMGANGVSVVVDGTFTVGDIADMPTVRVLISDMAEHIGSKVVEGIRNARTPRGNPQ